MANGEFIFAIPTYRLRDVTETVEEYDQNFWNNGHSTKIMVFDDSSLANNQKYYSKLEETETNNDIYYIGPNEKQQFIESLVNKLKDKKLEQVVNNLFRPSYGGNRNFTLMYSLGNFMISSDDDMRPYGLVTNEWPSLSENEVCKGKISEKTNNGNYIKKSYDILTSFEEVIGKKVKEIPSNFEKGELLTDNSMDLETNATKGIQNENLLTLQNGKVPIGNIVKIAQTFRSGTSDADALDYTELFLRDEEQIDPQELNKIYILMNFRPVVTKKNWRIDCGVSAYDNRHGLPPFFPTRLRFEDYIYRLWIQQKGIASAHVNAAQNHIKNNYMRNPLPSEILNEEIANLLKRKIKSTLSKTDDLTISFDYDGEVTTQDSEEVLTKISSLYDRVLKTIDHTKEGNRKEALNSFAVNLKKVFYDFETDFFQQNVSRLVDDEVSLIKSSLEIWENLVYICSYQNRKNGLPMRKVKNKRK